MLVLRVKAGERVFIDGGHIVLELVHIKEGVAKLAFDAPKSVVIDRESVHVTKQAQARKDATR